MINVVGLPLAGALKLLEAEGAPEPEVERVAAPADFRKRGPEDTREKIEFVAAQRAREGGGLKLRVVAVPSGPKE